MKHALVTGGSAGIGKETVLSLVAQGYAVILAARDQQKGDALVQRIRRESPSAQVEFFALDLSSFPSVERFAQDLRQRWSHIDALVLNAGLFTPKLGTNAAGYEYMFATTHLGHFLLTHHLLDRVKASPQGRIVVTSSVAHFFGGYLNFGSLRSPSASTLLLVAPFLAYGRSKLANVLFVRELQRRLAGTRVLAHAFHPGAVRSEFWRSTPDLLTTLIGPSLISEAEGADTQIYLATDPKVDVGGQYWFKRRVHPGSPASRNAELARRLWTYSEQALKIERFGEPAGLEQAGQRGAAGSGT